MVLREEETVEEEEGIVVDDVGFGVDKILIAGFSLVSLALSLREEEGEGFEEETDENR